MLVGRDLPHPAMRAQLDSSAQRDRPIGNVGACLGALCAAWCAVAEIDAAGPSLIVRRGDRRIRRPPMPAELVHRLAEQRAGTAERQRRHRRFGRGKGGIAGKAGDAHHPIVLGKERRQRIVVDRPVVGDAIQRLDAKVGRMQAREMRRVHDGRTTDAVEIHHLDRRVVVVDRVILRPRADVGARRVIAVETCLPIPSGAWILGWIHPAALFQAENVHFGFRK